MSDIDRLVGTIYSRRDFLHKGGQWTAALALANAFPLAAPWNALAQGAPGPGPGPAVGRMIQHSLRYLDLEMPAHLIDSWLTPVELFYVRNHIEQPEVNLGEWRLRVSGEVERPLELTYADLLRFEQADVANTLECAGNGRAMFRPRVPGIQWARGAVGNAHFSGPRLADVLRRAGVKLSGKHVMFNGLDQPPLKAPDFVRSIPMEKAMHADTLLATRINSVALPLEHGFPVRGIVPGWLGAASVKWVTEIQVLDRPYDGTFMNSGYRFPKRSVAPGESVPAEEKYVLTALSVKSLITSPRQGARLKKGPIKIMGVAWAGVEDVVRVDVSTDYGRTWRAAELGKDHTKYAWRLWGYTLQAREPGSYLIMARATDSAGRTQPLAASWNPSGYFWNVVEQVRIDVEA